MISSGPSLLRLAEFVNGYPFKPDQLSDTGLPVIRIRQLVDENASCDFAEPPKGAVFIDDGDLIFSWSGSLEVRLWNRGRALLNQHLFRVDPSAGIDRRWLRYVLELAADRLMPLMHGSAMTHVTRDMLRSVQVDVPSPKAQRDAANFLDSETTRIDALVEKKRRMIVLLDLRFRTLIGQAVTKGLKQDVPMDESGVDWIGWVPRGWPVVKIRHMATVRRGASPRPIDDPVYFDDDGDYAWVRISDVTAAGRYLTETQQRLSRLGARKSVRLESGALFVSIAATVGKPTVTKIRCCIHDGFVYFENLRLDSEFLYYVLASGLPYGGLGKLGTQLNLNTDSIGGIPVPVPPPDEQRRIVEYLDAVHSQKELIANRIERQVDLLKEHRQALITAAVAQEVDAAKAAA